MPSPILFKRLALAVFLLAGGAVGAGESPVLTLNAATEQAVQDNPDLAQMQARAQAMAAIPSQVGTLPDPVISFNALNLPVDTFDTRQEPMTQIQVGISQTLPFPGKLTLREQAAAFEAAAALQNVTEARWWLQKNVKTIWWGIFYLDHALQIIDSNQALLRQFIQITRTKYEVGEGLQQEVLLAQLELSKLLDQQIQFEGSRRNLAAQLNVLLDRPANLEITLPGSVDEKLPAIMAEAGLYQLAETARALLEAQRENINAAQARLELARKDYFPDLDVGAAYGARDDTLAGQERADFVSMRLSISVPVFLADKQAKAVDQRTSELMQQRYALQDQWNQVRGQISQAHSDYRRAREQSELFKTGIIPQARQTVASMLSGYQVNKVDFLNLLQSQITLFNYEMQYWNAFTEAQQALAQLNAVVGQEDIYE
ncbi:MAG: TolC family protein [Methylobacter sp.]|uniref:TolC family protein n=1 Tax=Methylobacter sp. TaxID=2051955 RepID=UPI002582BA4F|nr:TolC family protein [Methylobacter sp.]MCL7423043.1 TolC family protein [Methylobacter sp.]